MLIDLSIEISMGTIEAAAGREKMVAFGHIGTHFDVMDKRFPLEFTRRNGIVFDAGKADGMELEIGDIDAGLIRRGDFVAIRTGFIERTAYGTEEYFKNHPQVSRGLMDVLLDKEISIIGLDFTGLRRGAGHTAADAYCADRGVFVVENLTNLHRILAGKEVARFTAHTYPVNYIGMSGLPCRVVAEI
ncbi:MAG: cyclase family protein [Clostridia bacterium]|nr:cyclase family protein [Clostridia bacterium]